MTTAEMKEALKTKERVRYKGTRLKSDECTITAIITKYDGKKFVLSAEIQDPTNRTVYIVKPSELAPTKQKKKQQPKKTAES